MIGKPTYDDLKHFFDLSLDGCAIASIQDGRWTRVNTPLCRMLGWSEEELLELPCLEIVHPDDLPLLQKATGDLQSGKPLKDFKNRLRCKDGCYRWFAWNAAPSPANGLIYCVARDITESRQLEERLSESNLLMGRILDHTHMMAAFLDPQFNFIWVNRAYAEACGYKPSFFQGKNHFELYPHEENQAIFQRVVDTGEPFFADAKPFVYPERPERGVTYWDWSLIPLKGETGNTTGLVFTLADVTDRIRAEKALQESEKKFRILYENTPRAYQSLDENGCLLEMNETWLKTLGCSREEVMGKPFVEFLHPDWKEYFKENFPRFKAAGEILGVEFQMVKKDGTTIVVTFDGKIGYDEKGRFKQTHCMLDDITERKRAEEALQESERRFRALVTASSEVLYRMSPDWREMRRLHGSGFLANTEKPNRNWLQEYIPPDDLPRVTSAISNAIRRKRIFKLEHRVRRPDGGIGWTLSRAVPLKDANGEIVEWFGAASDITQRKRTEEALRESEELFRKAFHMNPSVMVISSIEDGRFLDVNQEFERAMGYSREEVVQTSSVSAGIWANPNERQKLAELLNAQGYFKDAEAVFRTKSGEIKTFILSAAAVTLKSVQYVMSAWLDVTERKKMDDKLRNAHEELEQRVRERTAQLEWKNRELREFTSVASHDLQEPLRKIQAFGDMLQHEAFEDLSDSARDFLSRMRGAANRMQKLIRTLLAYSRVSTKISPFERVDLKQLAEYVVDDLFVPENQTKPAITIGDLPEIDADPVQISQLFQNLVGNAIRYSRNGLPPVIDISSSKVQPQKDSKKTFCELRVRDNGIGFDMKYRDKIFQPFERLHGCTEYEGTGMGLAICRKIVERHDGTITAESKPGEGSTFIVTLPMSQM